MVSGSDPLDERFPEEYRIEVYLPPYLTDGRQQPRYTITDTDWNYGGTYDVNVVLYQGTTSTMRVSLLGGGHPCSPFMQCVAHMLHSRRQLTRQQLRAAHAFPCIHLRRQPLHNHRPAQLVYCPAGLVPALRPGRSHALVFAMGAHWRRSSPPWRLALRVGIHCAGRVMTIRTRIFVGRCLIVMHYVLNSPSLYRYARCILLPEHVSLVLTDVACASTMGSPPSSFKFLCKSAPAQVYMKRRWFRVAQGNSPACEWPTVNPLPASR